MWIRTYSSLWMLGGVILILYLGHLYICAMVVVIQIFMASELFHLRRRVHEDKRLPGFWRINWYFFFTAMLYVYGRIISQQLVNTVTSDKFFSKVVNGLIKYHMVICYFLYIAGMMWFILTLKKKMYKYQFGQFVLPASLIAMNDVAAYLFGFFFGRTPLIKLSPKKTWEGFIGASVATVVSAFLDLSTGWLDCDPGPLFKPEYYLFPEWLPQWFPWKGISVLPVQWHALCLGLFSSIIAPFGGFFASGLKRAFKIKSPTHTPKIPTFFQDFGDSIPGHGGFTDRMDCQMVMAIFAYIYFQSFIASQTNTVDTILDQIVRNLSFEEQERLYHMLGQIFKEQQLGNYSA
ncbi:hypothetical protein RD792_002525 [Penstemon davidsonii]|uniref:phosphatidate cytidylyltransferase n=1 Tax=Penstemon davidsonii TaxID=160366 RepID=A0ABR0DRC2_9LAMI|nr:hypothetical protein RD792_002525 [Penstemon davidsonii]